MSVTKTLTSTSTKVFSSTSSKKLSIVTTNKNNITLNNKITDITSGASKIANGGLMGNVKKGVSTEAFYAVGHPFNANSRNPRCWIRNNDTKEKMVFQFNPEDLPRSRSVNYTTISSPGMAYPLVQFTGGDTQEFDINLFFYDNPYSGKIVKMHKFIRSLLPPLYNNKNFKKPPVCKFAYGTYSCSMVVVKHSISEEWRDNKGRVISAKHTLSARRI